MTIARQQIEEVIDQIKQEVPDAQVRMSSEDFLTVYVGAGKPQGSKPELRKDEYTRVFEILLDHNIIDSKYQSIDLEKHIAPMLVRLASGTTTLPEGLTDEGLEARGYYDFSTVCRIIDDLFSGDVPFVPHHREQDAMVETLINHGGLNAHVAAHKLVTFLLDQSASAFGLQGQEFESKLEWSIGMVVQAQKLMKAFTR